MAQIDSPQQRAPVRPGPGRGGFLGPALLLVATAALAIIAIFNWPSDHPAPPPAPHAQRPVDKLARLEQRLAADEARLAKLEHAPDTDAAALDALAARLRVLEIATPGSAAAPPVADLDTHLDAYVLKSDEDALAARVTKLESRDAATDLRRAASALALANLVRASDGAGSFQNEWQSLLALMPNAPEARDLARYANGVPTPAMLAARFLPAADAALAADRRARATGWLDRLWVNASALVTITRVGARDGNDTESRLSRANERLATGDLDGAIADIRALDAPARAAMASWLADAQARAAVDHDLRALARRTTAALAQ